MPRTATRQMAGAWPRRLDPTGILAREAVGGGVLPPHAQFAHNFAKPAPPKEAPPMPENARDECCCPEFNPAPWDEQEVPWEARLFVKDRVRCLFHIPLNFAAVMTRNMAKIQAAEALPEDDVLVLADDNSLWGADVYLGVGKDVPDSEMTTLSGTFLTKVFEGPYAQMRAWMQEMTGYVTSRGKAAKRVLSYYTTCPKCAKKYGKSYTREG